MKLLVTGGAGFIGTNFIHYWLKHHSEDVLINFDKLTYAGNLENLSRFENLPNYHFVKGDITKVQEVHAVISEIDTVVHFAAETHVDRSINDSSIFVSTNVLGTQVLLEESLRAGVKRFHHISTDEVFGSLDLLTQDKFNENTVYNPRSPYAASKAGSDHLVRAYYHTYGLPVTITNCSNNFGPFMYPEKLFALAITNALENKPVPIYGDGLYVRDWLYVVDHCTAIDAVLTKGQIGETYCIGGQTETIDNLTIVKKILSLMGKSEQLIAHVRDRPGHDRRYAVAWDKIKNQLGWQPHYTLEEALKLTIEWYRANETWWKRLKSGEFAQYYQKQYG